MLNNKINQNKTHNKWWNNLEAVKGEKKMKFDREFDSVLIYSFCGFKIIYIHCLIHS